MLVMLIPGLMLSAVGHVYLYSYTSTPLYGVLYRAYATYYT